MAACLMHDSFQLLRGSNVGQKVGRPPDTERRQRRQWSAGVYTRVAQQGAKLGGQRFQRAQPASEVAGAAACGSVGVAWLQQ